MVVLPVLGLWWCRNARGMKKLSSFLSLLLLPLLLRLLMPVLAEAILLRSRCSKVSCCQSPLFPPPWRQSPPAETSKKGVGGVGGSHCHGACNYPLAPPPDEVPAVPTE